MYFNSQSFFFKYKKKYFFFFSDLNSLRIIGDLQRGVWSFMQMHIFREGCGWILCIYLFLKDEFRSKWEAASNFVWSFLFQDFHARL